MAFGTTLGAQGINEVVTLRSKLLQLGLEEAITVDGAPPLDRPLTSAEASADGDVFVVGYYFVDELQRGDLLGPLHVSAYDKRLRRWTHAPRLDDDVRGSVLSLKRTPHYVALYLRRNPSAGDQLLLDSSTLRLVARVEGRMLDELPDGSVLFTPNEIHFAPTHQARLLTYEPVSRKRAEVFPGGHESRLAAGFRERVKRAFAQLPPQQRDEMAHSAYGPVDDFDRDLGPLARSSQGTRVTFGLLYDSRLQDPRLWTVVSCDQQLRTTRWQCVERELDQVARANGLQVPDPNVDPRFLGWLGDLVRKEVERR